MRNGTPPQTEPAIVRTWVQAPPWPGTEVVKYQVRIPERAVVDITRLYATYGFLVRPAEGSVDEAAERADVLDEALSIHAETPQAAYLHRTPPFGRRPLNQRKGVL